MVTEFKVGHKYRWVGPASFRNNWNKDMDKWKDGVSRKCMAMHGIYVTFTMIDGGWDYRHCYFYFEEVKTGQLELEFEEIE